MISGSRRTHLCRTRAPWSRLGGGAWDDCLVVEDVYGAGAADSGCRDTVQGENMCTQRMALCLNMVTWAYEMHFYWSIAVVDDSFILIQPKINHLGVHIRMSS
jgi:hypothetical protein